MNPPPPRRTCKAFNYDKWTGRCEMKKSPPCRPRAGTGGGTGAGGGGGNATTYGTGNATGRDIVESHLDSCLDAGLGVSGINAEVMKGQWEYQLLGKGKEAADDLWLSRYLPLFCLTISRGASSRCFIKSMN